MTIVKQLTLSDAFLVSYSPSHHMIDLCYFINVFLARHMCFIVESIFQCLDYESLKSASLVCETWGQAILQGRLWQKLLEKNVSGLSSESNHLQSTYR